MQRYKIIVEYKGTAYAGWQTQKNAPTVQQTLEKAFQKALGKCINIVGSGRTNAGVHALGQVAHFDSDTRIPAEKIPYAVNAVLPVDISVKACEKVEDNFHARFSPKSKTYVYKLFYSAFPSPLLADTYHWVTKRPDVELMKLGAQLFIGEHDFKYFRATGSNVKDTVRTIYSIKLEEIGNTIEISVTGNGFLYNMVRILAGTLLYIGTGKLTIKDVYAIMNNGERRRAGKTLPAKGLCLIKVDY